ncbi:hypothetical protein [Clostridium saccharoperbutylacetonicum]|uniref:hypothetical protein n=1 Tax=Clostridium saccharoperbutylacetonicum TaxID=36745 RepID=UPI000983BF04|nr:hypothetical protein [Clostridium saccharoperbutylacetonicum]AQR98084.1 hypothetical protein CLSAP_54350 [Clostridium saccharoperbutylacetonicum]NSB33977.1 hypothetical protein [Clostridium saccharoperbutylacetonicum]
MPTLTHLNCRSTHVRIDIVSNYNLQLIAHAKLLPGQTKESDAVDTITDLYYEFLCTSKFNSSEQYLITCGSGAGRELIKLANITSVPPAFNPFIEENNGGNGRGGANNNPTSRSLWDPVAKELYNAIMWLICLYDIDPLNGPLLEIKANLENWPNSKPFPSKIKSINTIVKKYTADIKLTDKINEHNFENLRQFTFSNLNSILEENNVESYF